MTVSLRLNDRDADLIKRYAAINGTTVSELFRRTMLEKIEDEYDLTLLQKAEEAFEKDPATYTLDEVEQELGLR